MRRNGKNSWALRGLAALLLAVTFGYVPYHLYAHSGFARYLEVRRDLEGLAAQNVKLRAANQRLAQEAEALRTDMRVVERVARSELGWVRPGEVIFDLGQAR